MKRVSDGRITGYCKNLSSDEYFSPINISKRNMKPNHIFNNIFFELDTNKIYFDDFFADNPHIMKKYNSFDGSEKKKVDFFIRLYVSAN